MLDDAAARGVVSADMNPPHGAPGVQVAFRFPADLVARIDAYAEQLRAEHPGLATNRSSAAIVLLTHALDALEVKPRRAAKKATKKPAK